MREIGNQNDQVVLIRKQLPPPYEPDADIAETNALVVSEYHPQASFVSNVRPFSAATIVSMTCSLCKFDLPLVRSHIIPEFLYKTLYDEDHTFLRFSTEAAVPNTVLEKGLRERLLCSDCESRLSRVEDYASRVLTSRKGVMARKKGRLLLANLDYKQFKLFQLSILWRAGVSTLDVFKEVELGIHEERIRNMLMEGNPGKMYEYGCMMSRLELQREPITDFIVIPARIRGDGHIFYQFVFGGFEWRMLVSGHRPSNEFCDRFLQEDGTYVIGFREVSDVKFIQRVATKLYSQGKL